MTTKGLKALKLKANFRCFVVSCTKSYKNGEAMASPKKYHLQWKKGKHNDRVHKDEWI